MCGYYVPRKGGWDCHGLPVELEVEKELGISSKEQIEEFGIAEFNARCRESVFRYVADWNRMVERIGHWIDLEDPYVTMDDSYIESVWWSLRRLWDDDRLYEGHKVVPYCPRCGTALSSHEVALGYKDVVDPSVYVRLPVTEAAPSSGLEPGDNLLVWTTTPWTLISHAAVAAGAEIDYVRASPGGIGGGDRGRRGARRAGARRGLLDALGTTTGEAHGGHPLRSPLRLHPGRGLRPARPHGADRRLRHDRGRHRPRPHRARLRRGRLPARRAVRDDAAEPGPARRHLRRARAGLPGRDRLQAQPRDRRGARRRRQALPQGRLRARLPALLALRHRPPLLREEHLVHPHLRGQGPDAGRERADRLAPRAHQARPLRQVARGQRRLGALARPLLGHAAADLGVHRRGLRRALLRRLDPGPDATAAATCARTCTGPTSTTS